MKLFFVGIFIWGFSNVLIGQNLVHVKTSAKQDLDQAISELNKLRKWVKKEKIPLSSDVFKLEKEAQKKRSEVDR